MSLTSVDAFDASQHWRLNSQVSLRDETFGALAYHNDTRRLVYLKSRELVDIVRRLGEFASAKEAIDTLFAPDQRTRYTAALASLYRSGLLSGR